jgi:hypothetical protein
MNVLLVRWDTKPDKRIRGTFLRRAPTRRTSVYAADRWFGANRHGVAGRAVRLEQEAEQVVALLLGFQQGCR